MKLCPKCGGILEENTYFNLWMCTKRYCDYREEIKNSQWIEPLINGDLNFKINEIISVLNQITNPRAKGL